MCLDMRGAHFRPASLAASATAAASSGPARRRFFKAARPSPIIVATSPGGGYDTYGRLVAEYMQRYLPGSTFVVRTCPAPGT